MISLLCGGSSGRRDFTGLSQTGSDDTCTVASGFGSRDDWSWSLPVVYATALSSSSYSVPYASLLQLLVERGSQLTSPATIEIKDKKAGLTWG